MSFNIKTHVKHARFFRQFYICESLVFANPKAVCAVCSARTTDVKMGESRDAVSRVQASLTPRHRQSTLWTEISRKWMLSSDYMTSCFLCLLAFNDSSRIYSLLSNITEPVYAKKPLSFYEFVCMSGEETSTFLLLYLVIILPVSNLQSYFIFNLNKLVNFYPFKQLQCSHKQPPRWRLDHSLSV